MPSFLLEVDAGQVGTALEALARAGIPVRELGDVPRRPAPSPAPAADLFGGTVQSAAPRGAWTRALPGGIPGQVVQSAGQVGAGFTVWLAAAPGESIGWSLTAPGELVTLDRGPCPENLLGALGADELARVLRVATASVEE